MAMIFKYSCACGASVPSLDDAQNHANRTGHAVDVRGTITNNVPTASPEAIAAAAERRVRDAEIMRVARDRGLLKKVGVL